MLCASLARDVEADPGRSRDALGNRLIEGVRQIRGELDMRPATSSTAAAKCLIQGYRYLDRNLPYLMRLAGVDVPRTLGPGSSLRRFLRCIRGYVWRYWCPWPA